MNVLIIDDDEVNNFLCCKVMELSDFSKDIHTCLSVKQGIDYLKDVVGDDDKYPELLFLDINMPIETGWDFLNQFDALCNDGILQPIKIYMLSSSVYDDDVSKATTHKSVEEYVTKPLDEKWLKSLKDKIQAK